MEPEHYIDEFGTQSWRVNDQLHRLDGPAAIYENGTQTWWVNGQRHRVEGPAVIYENGYQAWWVHGKSITNEVEAWMKTQSVTWPWDEETQMLFVLTWG